MATVQPISGRKTGELCRLLEERERGDSDFQKLIEHPEDVVALIDAIKARESKILELVTTVSLPSLPPFDAEANLRVTPDKDRKRAQVVIGWVGDNVKRLVEGLVEPEAAAAELRGYKLRRSSLDGPIVAELGGEQIIPITWGQLYWTIKQQGRGQQGILLTNGWVNVFYLRDQNGVLWAARCYWRSGCGRWVVGAFPVTSPLEWRAGYQIFSR